MMPSGRAISTQKNMLIKYVGDDGKNPETGKPVGGRNLGRHGWVKQGAIISVTLEEYAMVLDDPTGAAKNFEVVPEPKAAK